MSKLVLRNGAVASDVRAGSVECSIHETPARPHGLGPPPGGRVRRNCTTSLPCTHLKVSKYGVHVTDTAVLSAYRGGGRWTGLTFQRALYEETNKDVLSSGPLFLTLACSHRDNVSYKDDVKKALEQADLKDVIRNVRVKLTEFEMQDRILQRISDQEKSNEYRNYLNHPLSRVLIRRRRLVLWSGLTSQ